MADDNAKELADREKKAFDAKENLDSLWQELALNFFPERADFTTEHCLGEEFGIDLFDSEPVRCRRDLGNARASMLRPRGQDWFRAETEDEELNEDPAIARDLDKINNRARTILYAPNSSFVRAQKEADPFVVTFGGAVKSFETDINRRGKRILIAQHWHLRDCAWLDDMSGVRQDVMFRKFRMSARHIKKRFPDAILHASITAALDKDKDKKFDLCHVMMPADEYEIYKRPTVQKDRYGERLRWVSVYYDSAHKMLLEEKLSKRFVYVVDRWETITGSQYMYSPAAMTGLADGRGMQVMARVLLEAGEKSLDPPLKLTEDAVKSDLDLSAAGMTWVDKDYDERMGPAIAPLLPEMRNIPIGIDLINRTTLANRDNWFLTKLNLPQQAKTAYETSQLVEEYIRANIPLFEPWEAGTAMDLDEIFDVLSDSPQDGGLGAFDDLGLDKRLSDKDLVFAFSNPLQDAIKRNMVNQAQQVLGLVAGATQADPQAGANKAVNLVKIVQDGTRGTGAPADWLNDEEDTKQAVAAQVSAQNILGAINTAGQAADVVKTGSEAAANLQGLTQGAPQGADGSSVYGPT